ncbi:MAG: methyl-accepting chemotaxis protein [Syntrophobacteraceae bacterium]|nr:methyl-accepting chemotaxis protein [Syntrophobacteraceae bacterium]
MVDLKRWSLRIKIIALGVTLPTILIALLFNMYAKESKKDTVEAFTSKARAICLTASATRQEMERKWAQGLFSVEELRKLVAKNEMDKVLSSVPVVTAWKAAMLNAKEGGYVFKVPKFSPRNPKNEPDAREAHALKTMEARNLKEYSEVDPAINAVRYYRAVHLSKTCLLCHGDPATSATLWGNSKGEDPTGAKMENWKEGELHGAFEVIQSLNAADRQLSQSMRKAALFTLCGLLVMALLFAVLSIRIVTNSVIKPIRLVIKKISNTSTILTDSARTVADSSFKLSDGAQKQAASLEESAAALEEVTSMTKCNDENVQQTSKVSAQVLLAVNAAHERMMEMVEVIEKIKESSSQIETIMKVVESMAFQTNLLSLNASVEAARAGEAGAGFAVVAEEVRALAARSADAAKQTAALVDRAGANSEMGVKAAGEVKQMLDQIVDGINRVSTLASEISSASKEQTEGVKLVNEAVSRIDSVTQTNAAVSEEVAADGHELFSQAESLGTMITRLSEIVGMDLNHERS